MFARIWRDHNLTIVMLGIGTALTLASLPFKEGTVFDLLMSYGAEIFGNGALFAFAWKLHEKSKPED